jgi:uncharacterized protein YhaN
MLYQSSDRFQQLVEDEFRLFEEQSELLEKQVCENERRLAELTNRINALVASRHTSKVLEAVR